MKTLSQAHSRGLLLLSLLAVLQATTATKNGIDIYSLTVDSKVTSRFAHTVVTSRVVNRANSTREATFQMELPKKAFITNFSMVIDGVTYPGNIKEKKAAQEQYSAAVARGESAGLVKATGRKTEKFQVSVNVAPAAKVTFELVYEELLQRQLGVYELLLKVQPQHPLKHLQMDIHIFEPQGISSLETESSFMTNELAEALTISQNETKAHIQFKPTLAQQQTSPEQQGIALDGNFIVRYDVNRSLSGGSIQIENGYFVHYFAPEGLSTIPKNVIFVIDRSGSMMGKKIQQTREALIKILGDLSPQDQFNLVDFSSQVKKWKPSLVPASAENVDKAKSYAASIQAHGGTNINGAMLMAVKLLDDANRKEQLSAGSVSIIILLTDGDPTEGETDPEKIQKNVQEAIAGQYSLFCLGFGFDVSYEFLEKMALENGGLARRIYQDSDSNLQLQDFYQEVANPLVTAVTFEYPSNAVEEVTRDNFRLLFKGAEMVVAGKLRDDSPDVLLAKVSGKQAMQNITFQMEPSVTEQEAQFRSLKYIFHGFMERLWAYLTIQQLLEQMVSASDAEKPALEARALGLSLNYNFVTPLTSMVVTKPEGQEQSQVVDKPLEKEERDMRTHQGLPSLRLFSPGISRPRNRVKNFKVAGTPLRSMGLTDSTLMLPFNPPLISKMMVGAAGMPGLPSSVDSLLPSDFLTVELEAQELATVAPTPASIQAPPIILPLPGQSEDRLCVNFKGSQGPMELLSDPEQGLQVTGQYEAQKGRFSWIKVTFKNLQLQVHATPEQVVVTRDRRSSAYQWKDTLFSMMPGMNMTMDKEGLLLLSIPDGVTVGLRLWHGPRKGLRLLLRDTDRFSSHVGGTLGQFYQNVVWGPPEEADDSKRTLTVQGQELSAHREQKLDYQEGPPGAEISCWCVEL
ncbi:inter-alpha-trypsin inhibitor heavy chain H4 isoform X2 [Sorex fumeus]|uniref:inter-alpha-trypsin inhibitor heavy chain H4 isoform X2 n=1 Tax=Sorex fumeus TaxID=62283 RepID=UPI0024AD6E04|nr:inter-alpha-trypsin inhibitor heavy chain H4 isoform X2 [Sorex fumeus]